ncbi:hypothetical protein CsSME_00019354 [Camellia sinensis var. sinensis]
MSFAAISDWVRPLGEKAFLFVFPNRSEAEATVCRRWSVGGRDLLLEWWSPLAMSISGKLSSPEENVWIRVVGLPVHLRGEDVYRAIGDRCGGFVEADESSVDLGGIRLRARRSEHIPSRVSVCWGMWAVGGRKYRGIWVG